MTPVLAALSTALYTKGSIFTASLLCLAATNFLNFLNVSLYVLMRLRFRTLLRLDWRKAFSADLVIGIA